MIATAAAGMSEASAAEAVATKVMSGTSAETATSRAESPETSTAKTTTSAKTPATKSAKASAAAPPCIRVGCGKQGKSADKYNRQTGRRADDSLQRRAHRLPDVSFQDFASFFIERKSTRIVPCGIAGSKRLAGISLGNFQSEKTAVCWGD
jgi:hypothetical protein